MDLKETYDKIAKLWHKDHALDNWWFEGVDKFAYFLGKGGLVLDVGCGVGIKSKYLLDKGMSVVGFDFSEKMVELAKKEAPAAKFFVLDLRQTEKIEGSFDGIFMQAVLLHIPRKDVEAMLGQYLGKLKAGGYIYIAVKEKDPEGAGEEVKKEDDYGFTYERFFSYFTVEDFRKYFNNLNVDMVYERVLPPSRAKRHTPWIQIIGRKK